MDSVDERNKSSYSEKDGCLMLRLIAWLLLLLLEFRYETSFAFVLRWLGFRGMLFWYESP